jgi:hypothetical protein
MVTDGFILYNNYRKFVLGSPPWDELEASSKNAWEDLANQLLDEDWNPTI